MLSESIHSLVDCGNQALLLIGIRAAATAPDRHHQYGYGKSIYFWSLVSALGTFWLGAGVSLRNSFQDLMNPTVQLEEITWDVWGVLGISFLIDGSVLQQTFTMLRASKPAHLTLWEHIRRVRDPTTLAVLLEDSGACLGVVMAMVGIGVSQATANPVFDSIGGVCISGLLAAMGLALARLNERYLLGQAVDSDIVDGWWVRLFLVLESGQSIERGAAGRGSKRFNQSISYIRPTRHRHPQAAHGPAGDRQRAVGAVAVGGPLHFCVQGRGGLRRDVPRGQAHGAVGGIT